MLRTALFFAATLGLFACSKTNADPAPTPKGEPAAKAPAAPDPVAKAPATKAPEINYSVRIIPGDATAGAPAKSVVEVTPKPGYKINLDFPSRVKELACTNGATLAKAALEKGDAEVTEAALRFTIPFTPASAGTVDLSGLADFSVCNERACKLIRDEKLAWQVAVK